MPNRPDEAALLEELVAIPSVSGDELAVARHAESTSRAWGLPVALEPFGVVVEVHGAAPGPTLALVSHLDTVPAGEGWTRDPFSPELSEGRLYGRGAGDAKASAAAMLAAAADVAAAGLRRGRLLVLLGFGEETRATTMGEAVAARGPVDAAIVGEPTGLDVAVAQRGLLMVDLVAHGDQRHAGHAGGAGFRNAAVTLAKDLVRLAGLFDDREHPILGRATATPTWLAAGVGRNVTPPTARALLDVRSTPDWTHEEIARRLRESLDSEVEIVSDRLAPCETPDGSRLLDAILRSRPAARRFGSPTCSDWVFLRGADAVKCGPGDTRLSHAPDEWVAIAEVRAARDLYRTAVTDYLS
jgi:acetylornithine deacetylase